MRPRNLALALVTVATVVVVVMGATLAHAEGDTATYNFASAQGNKQLQVTPGGEVEGAIYFYNIDGNRITHVTLEVSEAPAGWDVEIEPAQHEVDVEVSGTVVTIVENLHVEPSELLEEEPASVPDGMVCIAVPGRGYTLAVPAYITVSVPESEDIGRSGDIRIAGEAEWLGQGGAAAIKQARDFDFTVSVVAEASGYTESIIDDGTDGGGGFSLMSWLPAIVAAVVVLLGAVLIPCLVVKRKKR
ncbi:MAG: hypothetical protein SVP26_00235 [Chloroflexota bacterium]|nr:hypothetical protein [Chloroflexota bacterium]